MDWTPEQMSRWERFMEWMGWHTPNGRFGFDGVSPTSRCRRCRRLILQDSQGGWFTVGEATDE